MFIYFFNLAFIATVYFIVYYSKAPRQWFLVVSLVYLFLVSSLRDQTIGADYQNYVSAFNIIAQTGSYYMEKGYVLFNWVISKITDNYVGLAVAVNLMLFLPLYFLLRDRVPQKYWGLCTFIFAANPYMYIQNSFNALRQCCATGLLLVGMYILTKEQEKKIKDYVIFSVWILLAAQFHRVAYVMLIIPFVWNFKWKKNHWLIILIVAIIGNLFGVKTIVRLFVQYLKFNEVYLNYSDSVLNNIVYLFFIVLVVFYLIYRYNDFKNLSVNEKRMVDLYIFSLCFLVLALSNDMMYRVYMILSICVLPSVPIVLKGIQATTAAVRFKREHKIVERLYVFYYLAFYTGYIVFLAINNNPYYIPFQFCFG